MNDDETSDFIRRVLEDGEVTLAEVREVVAGFGRCMTENGRRYWVDEGRDGWPTTGEESTPGVQPTREELDISFYCQLEWLGISWPLNELAREMQANPLREDPDDLVARCLVRNGLVEEGFTGRDLYEFTRQFFAMWNDQEAVLEAFERERHAVLPGGVAWQSHEVSACVVDHRFDITQGTAMEWLNTH